jgi:hypothetical protein
MIEMKGWRLFYQNPLGLDLEWTNVDALHLHLFFIHSLKNEVLQSLQSLQ